MTSIDQNQVLFVIFVVIVYLSRNILAGLPAPSLSPTEMLGDHGLKADGLCLGWMQLSPCSMTEKS